MKKHSLINSLYFTKMRKFHLRIVFISTVAFISLNALQSAIASEKASGKKVTPAQRASLELMRARRERPESRKLGTLARESYKLNLKTYRNQETWKRSKFEFINSKVAKMKEAKLLAEYAKAKSLHGKIALVNLGVFSDSTQSPSPYHHNLYLGPSLEIIIGKPVGENKVSPMRLDYFHNSYSTKRHYAEYRQTMNWPAIRKRIIDAYHELEREGLEVTVGGQVTENSKNGDYVQDPETFEKLFSSSVSTPSQPLLNAAKELARARVENSKFRELGTVERRLYEARLDALRHSEWAIKKRFELAQKHLDEMPEFKDLVEYKKALEESGVPHEKINAKFTLPINKDELEVFMPETLDEQIKDSILSPDWMIGKDGSIIVYSVNKGYTLEELSHYFSQPEAFELLTGAIRQLHRTVLADARR